MTENFLRRYCLRVISPSLGSGAKSIVRKELARLVSGSRACGITEFKPSK